MSTPTRRQRRGRSLASLCGAIGAHRLHSKYDPRETTKPARAAFLARFELEVDPDQVLSNAERERRAMSARRAYFARLALASAQARKAPR